MKPSAKSTAGQNAEQSPCRHGEDQNPGDAFQTFGPPDFKYFQVLRILHVCQVLHLFAIFQGSEVIFSAFTLHPLIFLFNPLRVIIL